MSDVTGRIRLSIQTKATRNFLVSLPQFNIRLSDLNLPLEWDRLRSAIPLSSGLYFPVEPPNLLKAACRSLAVIRTSKQPFETGSMGSLSHHLTAQAPLFARQTSRKSVGHRQRRFRLSFEKGDR